MPEIQQPKDGETNFKNIFTKHSLAIPKIGDIITGTVMDVTKRAIFLDIPGITSGIIRGREMIDESGEYSNIKPDDTIEATVLEVENEKGEMELSLRVAGHQRAWDKLEILKKDKESLDVKITEANKGGLLAQIGKIKGFLPVSQLSPEHYPRVPGGDKAKILEKLKKFIGETFTVVVYDVNLKEEKLIFSEKEARGREQEEEIAKYKVGDVVKGTISAITDFGAFLKFNKSEGLIHISEIAWERVDDPHDFLSLGDEIKAQIIGLDRPKIFLSIKRIIDDPWKKIEEKYKIGDLIAGSISKINPYGAFVKVDENIHGLVHFSELSDQPVKSAGDALSIGDEYKFKIIAFDPKAHRLGLSLKQAKQDESNNKKKVQKDKKGDDIKSDDIKEEKKPANKNKDKDDKKKDKQTDKDDKK